MFNFFEKKPKVPLYTIFQDLGTASELIVDAVDAGLDFQVAMQGASVISALIGEAKKRYGLDVKPDSPFDAFLCMLKEQDIIGLAESTKVMAIELRKQTDIQHKGAQIYIWFGEQI